MAKQQYLLALDLGTTGTKSVVFDLKGNEIGKGYFNTPTEYPQPGWVAQDAQDIVELAYKSTATAIKNAGVNPDDIAGVSFTNMCTTFVPVDAEGNFLHPVLLWQDVRGQEMIPWIKEQLAENGMTVMDDYRITGMPISSLYTNTKILWLKKHHPDIYENTHKFVGMQALLTKAYGGEVYWQDKPSVAYTKVANADTFDYNPELAEIYGLDLDKYCEIKDPGVMAGRVPNEVSEKTGLAEGTPVFIGSCDQRCAAIGVGVAHDGEVSVCLGTAGVVHAYSSRPVRHDGGKIQILGHCGSGHWQAEANSSSAASSLSWFKDNFCQLEAAMADSMDENVFDYLTQLAEKSPPGARGLLYTPWLAAASCPNYDDNARATFTGMTFSHNKNDMIRALMEGVIFEIKNMLIEVEATTQNPGEVYRLSGGGSASSFWNQIQADIYGRPVETVATSEATCLGAAMCAAVGLEIYDDIWEAIDEMVKVKNRWEPNEENVEVYDELFELSQEAYDSLSGDFFNGLAGFQAEHNE